MVFNPFMVHRCNPSHALRPALGWLGALLLLGCSGIAEGGPVERRGDGGASNGGAAGSAGAGSAEPLDELGQNNAPLRLTAAATALTGVTTDDHVIYRGEEGTTALRLVEGAKPVTINREGATILIKRTFVLMWSNLDWAAGLGDLKIWSSEQGLHEIGPSVHGDDAATADEEGKTLLYYDNVREDRMDLMVARDLSRPQVLIADVGRGREGTCRAVARFVNKSVFVAWCESESAAARLQRFDPPEDHEQPWTGTTLAEDSLTTFSADSAGQRVFYVSRAYRAHVLENGKDRQIDAGVAWGMVMPSGDAAIYTVGDQLRRVPLPDGNPFPLVTNGFAVRTDFSPSFDRVLYSKRVTYENGTQRDLYLASTETFNERPLVLTSEPKARLSRTSFTTNGGYAVFLMDVPDGTELRVHPVDGGEPLTLPRVDTYSAGLGSRVVFTDNRSNPEQYPITGDLRILNAADGELRTLQPTIADRAFYVTEDRTRVVFIRPRVAGEEDQHGLYVQKLP